MNTKSAEISKRHSEIKSIIQANDVYNQSQLAKLLSKKNILVTQATLSRDLSEIGVVRVPTSKGLIYKINTEDSEIAFEKRIAEEVLSIEYNENVVLLKTYAGRAQGVALFLDRQKMPEILGTVAGDDTIIVVPKTIKKIKLTVEKLKTNLGIK